MPARLKYEPSLSQPDNRETVMNGMQSTTRKRTAVHVVVAAALFTAAAFALLAATGFGNGRVDSTAFLQQNGLG